MASTFADVDGIYDQAYFGQAAKRVECSGVGYPEYPQPLHESLWQLGFTGVASVLARQSRRRLLDIGCATGDFLQVARLWGWPDPEGVEVSEYAAGVARSLGLAVRTGKVDDLAGLTYSVITGWELIEHLLDVRGFMGHVERLLADDGALLISTPDGGCQRALSPNADWPGFQGSFEHIAYFSAATLRGALETVGAEVYVFEHDVHGVENLVGLALRQPLAPDAADWLRQLLVDPQSCTAAVLNQRVDPALAPYLTLIYAHTGHLAQANQLVDWLLRAAPDARDHQFLAGWVALQAGDVQRAREMLQLAGRDARLRALVDSTTVTAYIQASHQMMAAFDHQVSVAGEYRARVVELDQLVSQRDEDIRLLDQSIRNRDQQVTARNQAIIERDELISERDRQIALLSQQALDREGELEEALATARSARAAVAEAEARFERESRRSAEAVVALAERNRLLDEITSSTGWALLRILWRWRTQVVPLGSARDRALWSVLCSVRLVQQRGPLGAARALGFTLRTAALRQVPWSSARRAAARGAPRPQSPRLEDDADLSDPTPTASGDADLVSNLLQLAPPAAVLSIPATPSAGRYDVFVLSIIDWNFRFQRPQQLAARLATAGHRVFYTATTFRDATDPLLRPLQPGVVEVQLPGPADLSIYSDSLAGPLVDQLASVMAALRLQFQVADAVCIVDLPFWWPLAERLRTLFGWKIVYDCLDDYAGFNNTSERMLATEETLVRSSDLVLATSRSLLSKHLPANATTVLIPNGADFQHFRFNAGQLAPELASVAHPIVGYYGAISEWFDTQLVGQLARARADWQFVLIGSTAGADLDPLRGLPNVHLLGEKPYQTLPGYLRAFDVCVIPFRKTPLTDATNPVKLFEYLSAGKRIVATRLAEIAHYAEYVQLASSVDEWLVALEQALSDPQSEEEQARRTAFARANDWSERVQDLQERIADIFPLASVIVVTFNNLDYTRLCLESIYSKTIYPKFEVIVVDNASTDGTPEYLESFARRHRNFQFVVNEQNEGFARGNNRGVKLAHGAYIVFLNNDTIVSPGWLSRLTYYLQDERVGMVGPVTNSSGNESRIQVDYGTIDEIDAFAERYTRAHAGQVFEIRMLALFCVAMRRATVDLVGELDERFGIGTFEDDDYSMRVRALGLRIICAEDVFVHHWGGASFSRLRRDEYERIFAENQRKFEDKWGIAWEPHKYRLVSTTDA